MIDRLFFEDDIDNGIYDLIKKLDEIRAKSRKIGNSQRMYFQYYIRELFNKHGDSFLKVDRSIQTAYLKYQSQTL